MKKFEQRFEGKNNAGLRKQIREACERVTGGSCGARYEQAVLDIGARVALTASGKETLTKVAADYRRANGESSPRCDCDSCVAGGLQRLGAFG